MASKYKPGAAPINRARIAKPVDFALLKCFIVLKYFCKYNKKLFKLTLKTKFMKYFTIEELCASDTAKAKGIDNTPTAAVSENLTRLGCEVLDKIREAYGRPIRINCGYRSPALNRAVGGVSTSQHLTGEAADIANTPELQKKVLELVKAGVFRFDQLIIEKPNREGVGAWLHISYSKNKNRQLVLIFDGKNYRPYKP